VLTQQQNGAIINLNQELHLLLLSLVRPYLHHELLYFFHSCQ